MTLKYLHGVGVDLFKKHLNFLLLKFSDEATTRKKNQTPSFTKSQLSKNGNWGSDGGGDTST